MLKQLQSSLYCTRSRRYLNITLQRYEDIGFGLNSRHKEYILQQLNGSESDSPRYNYYIYAEEDMILTSSAFIAFIEAQERLKVRLQEKWTQFMIGFLRYEMVKDVDRSNVGKNVSGERVTWEYMPDKIHVVTLDEDVIRDHDHVHVHDSGRYIVTNNLNQAIYIISREQMLQLEEKCEFLSKPGRNAFYLALRKYVNSLYLLMISELNLLCWAYEYFLCG